MLAGASEKVASDLGLGSAFRRVVQSPPITTGSSQISRNMAEKWRKKSKFDFVETFLGETWADPEFLLYNHTC